MKKDKPILMLAPGSGMGHIVRASSIAVYLIEMGHKVVILSTSTYAHLLLGLTKIPIYTIPIQEWKYVITDIIPAFDPVMIVQDTFVWGFRGEFLERCVLDVPFVYLARRLKIDAYLRVIEARDILNPQCVKNTIVLEPLAKDHEELLLNLGAKIYNLCGPVRFPYDRFSFPVEPELDRILDSYHVDLIVHSGPVFEIKQLIDHARESNPESKQVIISPNQYVFDNIPTFFYFPAARLFKRAGHIYTGAGYNSMAEAALYKHKHTALPFVRHYDDQKARLKYTFSTSNAAPKVAEILDSLLS